MRMQWSTDVGAVSASAHPKILIGQKFWQNLKKFGKKFQKFLTI